MKSLDVRGVRESHLHFMLLKIEASFKEAVRMNVEAYSGVCSISSSLDSDTAEISTTFNIEVGDSNAIERCSVLQRFQSFEKWMWDNMLHPGALSAFKYGAKKSSPLFRICRICAELHFIGDICCPSCGQMRDVLDIGELCFADQVAQLGDNSRGDAGFILRGSISSPLRIRLLKIQLALVEVSSFRLFLRSSYNFQMPNPVFGSEILVFGFFWQLKFMNQRKTDNFLVWFDMVLIFL